MFRKVLAGALMAGALMAGAVVCNAQDASAQGKPKGQWVIALSNGYFGNTWRHLMVQSFESTAKRLKADGRIKDYIILNADGTVNQQSSQMSDLILRHVDAIIIDANSETALNGVIKKACDQDIKVISFDSIATEPCAWRLGFDFYQWGANAAQGAVDVLGGKGNVVLVRGVKGSGPDEQLYAGQMSVLSKHTDMKVIATLEGWSSGPVAQAAVAAAIPTLPHIDAVIGQGGGDDIGIAQAFQQAGGNYAAHPPYISGAGSAEFLRWWNDERKAIGYKTVSWSNSPGSVAGALYLALAILNGANPPKDINLPLLEVTNDTVEQYSKLPPGQVANVNVTEDQMDKLISGK